MVVEGLSTLAEADRMRLVDFQRKIARLQSAVGGALETAKELKRRMKRVREALLLTPAAPAQLTADAISIEKRIGALLDALAGDRVLRSLQENLPPSLSERVSRIVSDQRMAVAPPTQTHLEQYQIVARDFEPVLSDLRSLVEGDLDRLQKAMEAAGAPWTPGRIPQWKEN